MRRGLDDDGPRPVPASAGVRLRDLDRRARVAFLVVGLAMSLPFLVAAFLARADGWHPVGDDALMVTGARQVFTEHPPLLGETTSSPKYGVESNHPGPLVFNLYAPFVETLGGTTGLLVAAGLLAAASMALIGYVALRVAGLRRAFGAWAVVALVGISIGGTAYLYRPFKSVSAILPLMLFLFCSWALTSGLVRFLPMWLFAGSVPLAGSAQYITFVGGIAALTATVAVAQRLRRPLEADKPDPPAVEDPPDEGQQHEERDEEAPEADNAGRPTGARRRLRLRTLGPDTRGGRGIVVGTVVLIALMWWAPIYEALTSGGGNVRQLYRAVQAQDGPRVGAARAATDLARATVLDPATTRAAQAGSSTLQVLLGALVAVAAVALVVLAWRRLRCPDRWLVLIGGAAVALAALGVATLAVSEGYAFFRLLPVSVGVGFAMFGVASAAAVLFGPRVAPAMARLPDAAVVWVPAGAVALLGVALLVPGPLDDSREYLPWVLEAAPDLADEIRPGLVDDGVWHISESGPRSALVTKYGIAAALEGDGLQTDLTRPPGLGARLGYDDSGTAGHLLVVPAFQPPPRGDWDLVAQYTPDDRDEEAAALAAAEVKAYALETGGLLDEAAAGAIPRLLCPEVVVAPAPCPEADELLATDDLMASLPDWVVALVYNEEFDETFPFHVVNAEVPPDDLLERLRDGWVDIPLLVYQHDGPLPAPSS